MFPWRGLVSGGSYSGWSLLSQIRVSIHTLSKACFRGVNVFPAEVNLVTSLLCQIRAKSAPDSWSLAIDLGQVCSGQLVSYANEMVFPWRGLVSGGSKSGCELAPPD